MKRVGSASFPIVGIGASAGGLEAFKRFFKSMPPESGMAFVLIQHLDPNHKSLTANLLSSYTVMKVTEVSEQMPIESNHVYVIPPNKDLTLKKGVLSLTPPLLAHGFRLPIDFFFRVLAEDQKQEALCMIFSGTGTDGTLGLKAVKECGGMVVAQNPETAQFDGMPRSAIGTGLCDYVVDIESIPKILIDYVHHARMVKHSEEVTPKFSFYLESILSVLCARTKSDFRYYKQGSLMRRIDRRMSLNHILELADYLKLLQKNEYETRLLFKDLLISVTRFFRDPKAFAVLKKEVIPRILAEKKAEDPIRLWVPGCASGEEPYSIAILLLEQIEAANKNCPIQIFASDIDEEALAFARTGLYPQNIAADISQKRLQRFFIRKGSCYQVGKQLRDSVVFAVQNLISDPPFSQLNFISCRNILIYLEPEIQKKIIALFHFVLKENGSLFLGSSETIGRQEDLFSAISKKYRVYQRIETQRRNRVQFPLLPGMKSPESISRSHMGRFLKPPNLGEITKDTLLEQFVPFAVLINRRYEILYLYGHSGPYLELTTGEPTQDLMVIARKGLRSPLRNAVLKSIRQKELISIKTRVLRKGGDCPVRLTVFPVQVPRSAEGLLVVLFSDLIHRTMPEDSQRKETDADESTILNNLENELSSMREDLREVIEEGEVSSEELKTSNEEVMSMNEELQSTNEELETSKEELQSLNEEMTTVNHQLQEKIEELASSNDDLANLLKNTDTALIFIDKALRVKRFTPATTRIFNLIPSDIGRPLGDIAHSIKDLNLVKNVEAVLRDLTPIESEVSTQNGSWYILRIRPYRTEESKIEGLVVTLTDITRLTLFEISSTALAKSKVRIELLLNSTGEAIYGVDNKGRCTFVNAKLIEILGYGEEELIGKSIHEKIQAVRADGSPYPWKDSIVYQCIQSGKGIVEDKEFAWKKDGTSFPILCTAEPIREAGAISGAVVIFRDMTEAHALSEKLDHQARHDSLTGLVNREEFEQRLKRVLESTLHSNIENAMCYLDLDQFKVINDSCGHLAGDELLRQVADVIGKQVRKRDTIGRLGGDEFGVLMEHCDLHEAERAAHGICDAISAHRFLWEGKTHSIGVSIGIVSIQEDAGDLTDVLKAADAACYAAKDGGRNRIHIYREKDTKLTTRHGEMQWVGRINSALEENKLLLTYQPIVANNGLIGKKVFYEFLLRMKGENGELIPPGAFLGAAERYDLSVKIDRWVLGKAFQWLGSRPSRLKRASLFSINLSGQSLGDEAFLHYTIDALKQYAIPPEKICWEITETGAISNLTGANRFMHALKNLGCRFALDDFGTGLSSFAYLKALPVDYLKIAGVFVSDVAGDPIDLAMVKSINAIGQVMGMKTIAESVENEEILTIMREIGVDYLQGYALGKPLRLSENKSPVHEKPTADM